LINQNQLHSFDPSSPTNNIIKHEKQLATVSAIIISNIRV